MKILAKKIRILKENNFGRQLGQIKPLFKINDNNEFEQVKESDYPNNGLILVFSYELLKSHITTDYFFISDDFFINDVDNPTEDDPTFSLKKITYNQGISHHFREASPFDLIPVYKNSFNFNNLKLNDYEGIKSDVFFIENDLNLYGPFERNGIQLKAVRLGSLKESFDKVNFEDFLDQFHEYDGELIFKYSSAELKNFIVADNDGERYITDFYNFITRHSGFLVTSSASQIIDWASRKIEQLIPDFEKIKEVIVNEAKKTHREVEKIKWKEFVNALENNELAQDGVSKIIESLSSKGLLSVEENQMQSSEFEKEKNKLIDDIKSKGDEIVALKNEISFLRNEEKKSVSNVSNINPEEFPTLYAVVKDDGRHRETEEILKLNKSISYLEATRDQLDKSVRKLELDKREISDAVEKIKSTFNQTKVEHTAKLAEAKIYTDLLNGMDIPVTHIDNQANHTIQPILIPYEKKSIEDFVNEIQNSLKLQGRDLEFNDAANLILTLNQSFLTILAGAPGVGKTSLINKLSAAYGLDDDFGFLDIPCAKGWTSSKDLVGFFNPLTQRYQPARTKLKWALEQSSAYKNSPYWILLDEANLSPLEHYWSDFIKLADFEYPRKIKVSDRETIEFGEGFRFIATINQDHTTENLSNRLLDRATIIQIEKPSYDKQNIPIEELKVPQIYDCYSIQALFKENDRWKREEKNIDAKLNEIILKLEGNYSGIIVSPRKRNSIINYTRFGTGLLKGNDFVALDYAISQQLFPLINMRGDKFGGVLEEIKKELGELGMVKSHTLLSKIIERGKEFKHFKYVYY